MCSFKQLLRYPVFGLPVSTPEIFITYQLRDGLYTLYNAPC